MQRDLRATFALAAWLYFIMWQSSKTEKLIRQIDGQLY